MNWYKTAKIHQFSSITFYPAGSDKIAQPMLVDDVANDISHFILREMKMPGVRAHLDDITGDGASMGNFLGIINFYENKGSGLTPQVVQTIINAYNKQREGRVKIRIVKQETSRMFNCPVVRVQVFENNTSNYPTVPSLNIANDSAYQLLRYLEDQGASVNPSSPSGSISADVIKYILSDKSPPSPEPYGNEMAPSTIEVMRHMQDEGMSAKMVDYTRPITQRFPYYMKGLQQIVEFIDKNQLPDRRIVYA